METDTWYLLAGYGGGGVARIRCANATDVQLAKARLIASGEEASLTGIRPFVNVTDHASLSPADLRFVYLEYVEAPVAAVQR